MIGMAMYILANYKPTDQQLREHNFLPIKTAIIIEGGAIICEDKQCPQKKECANHVTAGDFRSEDGFTPNLIKVEKQYYCDKKETKSSGMLLESGKVYTGLF